jgi:hypothetical protein
MDKIFSFYEEEIQMGSLAGAAHLLKSSVDVLRQAQFGGKPNVECKNKSLFDLFMFYVNFKEER